MKKLAVFIFICFVFCTLNLLGQTKTDEDGVKECLQNYMSGTGDRVEKAFHASATMKYVDYKTGEFKDVPIAEFIGRIKSNPNAGKSDRKIEIVSMNLEGNAAQAKIKIEAGNVIMNDYMNLLKINGEWKIVSKIFSRADK
ncbi:MAG: nuclear transport factor 2 family protein [Chitinophagaceae bacterium]|nr:nuclear transport factor 2 family protein [Chitinophagaceae bacterium]